MANKSNNNKSSSNNKPTGTPIPNRPTFTSSTPNVTPGPWKSSYVMPTAANTGTNAPEATQQTAAAAPQPSRMQSIKSADNLGQAIKMAASNDAAIGGKEMKQLMKINGSSVQDVQARLNKINSKAGAKQSYIGFKGNAYNKLMGGGFDTTEDRRSRLYGGIFNNMFGDGAGEKLGFMNPMDRSGSGKLAKGMIGYTTPGVSPTQLRIASGNNSWSNYLGDALKTDTNPIPDPKVDPGNKEGGGDGGAQPIAEQPTAAPTIEQPVNPADAMIGGGAGGAINGSGSVRTRGKKGRGGNISGKMGLLQTKMASNASGIGNNYGSNWSLYNRSLAS